MKNPIDEVNMNELSKDDKYQDYADDNGDDNGDGNSQNGSRTIRGHKMPVRNHKHLNWMEVSKRNGYYMCNDCDQRMFHILDKVGESEDSLFFSQASGWVNLNPGYLWEVAEHNVTCGRCENVRIKNNI
jgi:hypothetical protein